MIERDFDVPFVADLALHEKQIRQNYRPVMAVPKWFARRPGTLFRALLLSEFTKGPLRDKFYRGQSLKSLRVLDPFMGGGTTLVEANRVGCAVTGLDINPMAWWIVRQEITALDVDAYRQAADALRRSLAQDVGPLYRTKCHDGLRKVQIPIRNEWIGDTRNGTAPAETKEVSVECADAADVSRRGPQWKKGSSRSRVGEFRGPGYVPGPT